MFSGNSINNRSFLWIAFFSSVLGIVMLSTNAFWYLSKTMALSLWTSLAGYALLSLIQLPKPIRTTIRIICLIASVCVLYDVLNVLPRISLTNNSIAWLLFGAALSADNPKRPSDRFSVTVFPLLLVSLVFFAAFSWLRMSGTARSIPHWIAYRDVSQIGRIIFLYLTIFLSFVASRTSYADRLVDNKVIRWGMIVICIAFAIVSIFFRRTFWGQWYTIIQFVVQPIFLFTFAKIVLIIVARPSQCVAEESRQTRITKLPCRYDVFISYRKAGGSELSDLIKSELKHRGYKENRIFMDTHSLSGGDFRENIKNAIESSANVILIVSEGCFTQLNEDSTFLFEIRTALEAGVNIVPFCFNGTNELNPDFLPEDAAKLLRSNAVIYSHDYPNASYDRLKSFLVTARKPFPVKQLLLVILVALLMAASWVGGYLITPRLPIQEIEQEFLGK